MMVGREHLAGLEMFRDTTDKVLPMPFVIILEDLIEQASAAPEQEAVAWVHPAYLNPGALGFEASVNRLSQMQVPLYTHADPSEVERLRADLSECSAAHANLAEELRAIHNTKPWVAQRQLAEAQELLRHMQKCSEKFVTTPIAAYKKQIDAFLSATAQPDAPDSAGDIPSFDPGNGNKARRRMEELGMSPSMLTG